MVAPLPARRPRGRSPSAFDVIDANQPVVRIKQDSDRVESQGVGVRAGRALLQPRCGEASQASLLCRAETFERDHGDAWGSGPPRLDLDKCEHDSVERDQVDLAMAGADVAIEDREASVLKMGGGQTLAQAPQDVPRIGAVSPGPRAGAGWVVGI